MFHSPRKETREADCRQYLATQQKARQRQGPRLEWSRTAYVRRPTRPAAKAKASRAHPRRRFTNGITATMGVSSSEEASPALVRTGKTLGTGEENSCVLQDACLGKGSPAGTGEQAGTGATAGFWPTGRGCSEVTEAATATGRVDSTHAVNGGSSRYEESRHEH